MPVEDRTAADVRGVDHDHRGRRLAGEGALDGVVGPHRGEALVRASKPGRATCIVSAGSARATSRPPESSERGLRAATAGPTRRPTSPPSRPAPPSRRGAVISARQSRKTSRNGAVRMRPGRPEGRATARPSRCSRFGTGGPARIAGSDRRASRRRPRRRPRWSRCRRSRTPPGPPGTCRPLRRYGEAGDQHGPPGGRRGDVDGLTPGAPGGAFGALAREVEERVVDADGHADQDHDLGRRVARRGELAGERHQPGRGGDRRDRQQDRHASDQQPAEGHDQDGQRQPERVGLGLLHVLAAVPLDVPLQAGVAALGDVQLRVTGGDGRDAPQDRLDRRGVVLGTSSWNVTRA